MFNLLEQIKNSLIAHKERQAFCFGDRYYSYLDLKNSICRIANLLRSKIPEDSANKNIGIVTNNDFETYSALLACWFTGLAYVPISHGVPKDRNGRIILEAGIKFILSSTDHCNEIISDESKVNLIQISDLKNDGNAELDVHDFNNRIAYIIFTSGSTGTPKGVTIRQSNLAAFIENFFSTGFDIEASDRCLQMFELTFDVSISSFLLPLFRGACVYPVGGDGIRYVQVLKLIQQYQLTSIQIVPSVIRLGGPLLKRLKFPWIKNCIVTGEATSIDLIPEWKSCLPNARLFNFYGPTEATIYCSFYECDTTEPKNYHGMLSIGKTMGNTELLILGKELQEVDQDVKGELYIGGSQLSEGYLNNPGQNSAAFIPISTKGGKIFYKSGDMVYRDAAGDIYYCGRFDNQVKIQGFRIELGEIEFLVRERFELNNVVIVLNGKNSESELMLVVESGQSPDIESIMNHLRKLLPPYMLPAGILFINGFPLTESGKTDRRKIKEAVTIGVE